MAAIQKATDIVNFIRKSVIDTEEVYKAVGFRLVAKNITRWNSQCKMIRSVVNAFEKDPMLPNRLNATKKNPKLTAMDIKILKEILLILEPFEEVTDNFQADFETIGSVVPAYIDLLNKVTLTTESRGTVILNPLSPLAGKISHCKNLAATFKLSLEKRLSFVLHSTSFVLGWFYTNLISFL